VGGVHTESTAEADTAGTPHDPVTTHRYFVPLMLETAVNEYDAAVPPLETLTQPPAALSCHWYSKVPVPVPVTEKVACAFAVTFWFAGFEVDAGVHPERVTMFEGKLPQPFDIMQWNCAPVSLAVTTNEYVAAFEGASAALVQVVPSGLRCHW
jgi:hypothetical protein